MEARYIERLESGLDLAAAAIFAAAAGYAMLRFGWSPVTVAAAAGATLLASWRILAAIKAGPPVFEFATFDAAPLPEVAELDELILTDADLLDPADRNEHVDELVLEDVLAKLEGLSRVVRLFDTSAMPTPGELKSRIDAHLEETGPQSAGPDASQALHEALSELRRTLR